MIGLIFSIFSGHYLPAAGPFVPSEAGSTVMRRIFWIRRFCSLRKREALEAASKRRILWGVRNVCHIDVRHFTPFPLQFLKSYNILYKTVVWTRENREKKQISTRSLSQSLPLNDTSVQTLVTGFFAKLPGKLKIFLCGIFNEKNLAKRRKTIKTQKTRQDFIPDVEWRICNLQVILQCAHGLCGWAWQRNVRCAHKASYNGRCPTAGCPTVQIKLKNSNRIHELSSTIDFNPAHTASCKTREKNQFTCHGSGIQVHATFFAWKEKKQKKPTGNCKNKFSSFCWRNKRITRLPCHHTAPVQWIITELRQSFPWIRLDAQ